MLTEILSFLTDQKVIITGAATTISELVIIIVNTYRKLKAQPQNKAFGVTIDSMKLFLWSANPINLFRKA